MNSIGKLVETLRGPVDTLVYLGAGRGDVLPQVFALRARQAVLVEGDAENAAALQAATAARQGVQGVSRVVTPEGGAVTWHRYDLPTLNCPLEAGGLKAYYPRLRELERHAVNSTAIGALLNELAIEAGGLAILVIDLPGQENALLAACSSEQVRRFDAIVLRGCARALYKDASLAPDAVERLRMEQFTIQSADTETEPLWQATLLHFDRQAYEREQLRETLARTGLQIVALTRELDEGAKLREVLAEKLVRAETALHGATAERDARTEQLTKARDEQVKLVQEREAQLEPLAQARGQLEKALADRDARIAQLTKAQDEQVTLVQEREAQLELLAQAKAQLEKAVADRDMQIVRIAKAREEQAKLAHDRLVQLEQSTKAHQQQAASAADRIAEFERQARERRAKLVELQREVAQLEEEQRSASKRQQVLYEELLKAEAQLELIKDVTLREPSL